MKTRSLIFCLLLGSWAASLNAAPVDMSSAKKTAQDFYGLQFASKAKSAKDFVCVYPEKSAKGFVPYYIFNVGDKNGFVIVSGDDNTTSDILAYSDKGCFEVEDMAPNVAFWMQYMEEGVRMAASSEKRAVRKANDKEATDIVAPLLGDSIRYNQSSPYNLLCPLDRGKNSYTGCAATALAVIARYYGYPAKGRGTVSYKAEMLDLQIDADLSESTYDWENILPAYDFEDTSKYTKAQVDAIALLMRDAGYCMEMDYSRNASGATGLSSFLGAVEHFAFDSLANMLLREYFDDNAQWIDLIKKNLDKRIPVYYMGQSPGGGHAFVCDGYRSDDFFHFHWGWGGYADGYFLLQLLNPDDGGQIGAGSGGGYTGSQYVVLNMVPQGMPKTDMYYKIDAMDLSNVLKGVEQVTLRDGAETDSIALTVSSYYNWCAADFDGAVALALYRNGEFKQLVSEPVSLKLTGLIKGTNSQSAKTKMTAAANGVEDGDYELYVVAKPNMEGAGWVIVNGRKQNSASGISYLPVTVKSGKFSSRTVKATLKLSVDIPVVRQPSYEIYRDYVSFGTAEETGFLSKNAKSIELLVGVPYIFRTYLSGFDSANFTLTIYNDTTVVLKMWESMCDPMAYTAKVNGNNIDFYWKKQSNQETATYNPQGYSLYLDSVYTASVGKYTGNYGHYQFENVPAGKHAVGVRSIYMEDSTKVVYWYVTVTQELANEEFKASDCRLQPNPSFDGNFSLDVPQACRVEVCALTGRVLFEKELPYAGRHTLNLEGCAPGMYIVRLFTEDGQSVLLKAMIR